MDTNKAAFRIRAEELERSKKAKLKNIKWTTILVKVPICPKCNNPMQHELDPSMRKLQKLEYANLKFSNLKILWVCSRCRTTI